MTILSDILSDVLPYWLNILAARISVSRRQERMRIRRTWQRCLLCATTPKGIEPTEREGTRRDQRMPLRTKYIQLVLSLDKPLRSCLGLMWVRQVDWEPDKFALVFSQPLLFHPR